MNNRFLVRRPNNSRVKGLFMAMLVTYPFIINKMSITDLDLSMRIDVFLDFFQIFFELLRLIFFSSEFFLNIHLPKFTKWSKVESFPSQSFKQNFDWLFGATIHLRFIDCNRFAVARSLRISFCLSQFVRSTYSMRMQLRLFALASLTA